MLNILTAVIVDHISNDDAYYSMPKRSPWQQFIYYINRLVRRYEDPVVNHALRAVDEIDVDGLIIPKASNRKKEYEELKLQMEARFRKDIRFQLESITTLQKSLMNRLQKLQNMKTGSVSNYAQSKEKRASTLIIREDDKFLNILSRVKGSQ